ncbi:hypothetical protein NA78x_002600 [Anatilimnocola sp. NA78]|uniref:hypothetical protein n=1 Tax=Anatilimnocola sp. NA78 TaxID=3415683 RepID=UPI003CE464D7
MLRSLHYLLAIALLALAGCSPERGVVGGTKGTLRSASGGLSDVQISVYRTGDFQQVGFAVTKADGAFELLLPGATGPLHLPAGEYAFTLESVSPAPIHLPRETSDPQRTPLRKTWSTNEQTLELAIP